MRFTRKNALALSLSFVACSIMALTSGCASGGYKLTRQYARWVNSQNIILRIILYILTSVVFFVTLLLDVVVFNTMDFWNGTVAAGTYHFNDDTNTYMVKHEFQNNTQLRKSTIVISNSTTKIQKQEIVLQETPSGEIELFVDGQLRSKATGLGSIPIVSIFNTKGIKIRELIGLNSMKVADKSTSSYVGI